MRVRIPTPLQSYTEKSEVDAMGSTVRELLDDLDRQFPGIRFRLIDEQDGVRPHMRIFVNRERVVEIGSTIEPGDEIQILQALSGG